MMMMMIKRGSNCCETLCNTNSLEVSWFSCGLALCGGGSITGVQKLFVMFIGQWLSAFIHTVQCPRALHHVEKQGIEPLTFWLVDDPLYLLSPRQLYSICLKKPLNSRHIKIYAMLCSKFWIHLRENSDDHLGGAAFGDGGEEELSFNRKRCSTEPGSGKGKILPWPKTRLLLW